MVSMTDPNLSPQAHTSLETRAYAQAHTMLEEAPNRGSRARMLR
jgi:hypothetical protein